MYVYFANNVGGFMRILGIDFGEARIGIAVSDPLKITAQPLETIYWNKEWKNPKKD